MKERMNLIVMSIYRHIYIHFIYSFSLLSFVQYIEMDTMARKDLYSK